MTDNSVLQFFEGWMDIIKNSNNESGKYVIEQDHDTIFTCPDCNHQHKAHDWKHAFCANCDVLL